MTDLTDEQAARAQKRLAKMMGKTEGTEMTDRAKTIEKLAEQVREIVSLIEDDPDRHDTVLLEAADALEALVKERDASEQTEQLQVQLAGCLSAAEGWGGECKQGDYGWSPAFEAVKNLRKERDALRERLKRAELLAWQHGARFDPDNSPQAEDFKND